LPKTVRITHKFEDAFTLIASRTVESQIRELSKKRLLGWLQKLNWLLFDERSNTGQQLRFWMCQQGWRIEPTMQLDNFDLIINLVAIGMGVSFVPIRALALYNQRRTLIRIPVAPRFTRDLVVVIRKHRKIPEHLNPIHRQCALLN